MKALGKGQLGVLSLGVLLALFGPVPLVAKEGPSLTASELRLDPSPGMAWALHVTEDGHLWISDAAEGAVLEYGPDGRRARSMRWKRKEGHQPGFLASDGETIAVADGNDRVVFFDRKEGTERTSMEGLLHLNPTRGFFLWKGDLLLTGQSYDGCMEPSSCINTLVLVSLKDREARVRERLPAKAEDLPALFCLSTGHPAPLKDGSLLIARSLPPELRLYGPDLSLLRRIPFFSDPPGIPLLKREELTNGEKVSALNRNVVQIVGAGAFAGFIWALIQRPGPHDPLLELRFFSDSVKETALLPVLLPDGFPSLRFVRAARMSPSGELFLLVQDAERAGPGRTRLFKVNVPIFCAGSPALSKEP
jgi:hypothetical protein